MSIWLPAGLGCIGMLVAFAVVWITSRDHSRRPGRTGLRLRKEMQQPKYEYSLQSFDLHLSRLVDSSHLALNTTGYLSIVCMVSILAGIAAAIGTENEWIGIGIAIALLALGYLFLQARRNYVRMRVEEQVPHIVELIAGNARAGGSVEAGLVSIADKASGYLARDLKKGVYQVDLGLHTSDVFEELADRYQLTDLRMLASVFRTHRQTGGNVAEVIEKLARIARERLAYRQQLRSMTATARLAAIIVGLAAPTLCAYYLFRGYQLERMWNDTSGRFFLLLALALEIVGALWIIVLTRRSAV
jgi:tight adherence protein B